MTERDILLYIVVASTPRQCWANKKLISYKKWQDKHRDPCSLLQLGLCLGLLQHGVQLGRLHDVALDLELAAHEEALGIGLALDELAKVLLREAQCD